MTWHKKLRWYHRSFLLLACCWVFFGDRTFAQNTTPIMPWLQEDGIRIGYDQWLLQTFTEGAEIWLKVLYLIFWPLLAIAAAAMDNSLVYGGAFHLTWPLFKFRQIIRTFANYTIWLYFVGSILAAFFWNKLENVFSWLIKNVALAAILVNMSRWIIAALIDLSTLATFALWALPLHALKNDETFKNNIYFMKTYNNLNINASTSTKADQSDFSMMYWCTQWEWTEASARYYLPCAIDDRKLMYKGATSEPLTWEQYKQDFMNVRESDTNINTDDISDAYCVYDKQILRNNYWTDLSDCKEFQRLVDDGKEEWVIFCAKIDDIVTKAVNNTWPLQTIFSSILNMSELATTTNTWSIKEVWLSLLIKIVFGLALIIPLIALAVVMIVRVVYLWLIIVFSPIITIVVALQRSKDVDEKIDWIMKSIFKPTQIINLIFLPVIATFWLSISIVFLSLLKNLPLIEADVWRSEYAQEQADGCYNDIGTALGMKRDQTPTGTSYDLDMTELNFTQWLRKTWADIWNMMSWLIINFFGIALMRMVVFATLKTNEFTEWIATTIDDTAKDRMGTIPLPLAWGLWLSSLKEVRDMVKEKYVWKSVKEQNDLMREFEMWIAPETQELRNSLIEGQKDPSKLGWLNDTPLVSNTDFYSDYQVWSRAYAQKAKSHYSDGTKLKTAGEAYARANGRVDTTWNVDHAEAIKNINTSLEGINNRDDALSNKEFVSRMHTENDGYDKFLSTRDNRTKKTSRTALALEAWLKKISGQDASTWKDNFWSKAIDSWSTSRYLYENNTKLTLFKRDKNKTKLIWAGPKSYDIDNGIDPQKLTEAHIELFNQMLILDRARFSELEFFKKINNQAQINTVEWKVYEAKKDASNNTISYDLK